MKEPLHSQVETVTAAQIDDASAAATEPTATATVVVVEKRKATRHRVRWRALVLLNDGSRLPAHIVDISEGGMSVVSAQPLATHMQASLAVYVPEPSTPGTYIPTIVQVTVRYQVLRGTEFAHGVSFHEHPQTFLDRMHKALRHGLLC